MQLIKPIIRGQAKSFVPKAKATQAYNDYIQEALQHTVWTSCISWYHAGTSLLVILELLRILFVIIRGEPSGETHDLACHPDIHVVDDANTNLARLRYDWRR